MSGERSFESMNIQWFPGHMTKARRMMEENIKLVDAVCELLDARIPNASRNPEIDKLAAGKPRLVILNRIDLADPEITKQWREYFKAQGLEILETDARSGKGVRDFIPAVLGPLGRPTDIRGANGEKPGHVVCVGGGIGVAPMHPIAQALKAAGNRVTIIMGARNKSLFVMEDEMRAIAGDDLILITDDGSSGRKGLVTDPLKELCEAGAVDEVITIGPPIMMKFCALTTKPFGVKTVASLNTVMIDGTGMCGGCRVSVGGETKFVCVDGPEFDAHKVDWDLMLKRMGAFKPQEAEAKEHVCRSGIFAK